MSYEAKFNQRARWRLTRHAGPNADGVTRWRCPFCSGLLRSRAFPKTMRNSRTSPLVEVSAAVVESANSALKGAFADLGGGFFRVIGIVKTTVLLRFTLAAYNLDRIRSYKAKHGVDDNGQVIAKPTQQRARRRTGTWAEVIETGSPPPPTWASRSPPPPSRPSFRSASARSGPGEGRHEGGSEPR